MSYLSKGEGEGSKRGTVSSKRQGRKGAETIVQDPVRNLDGNSSIQGQTFEGFKEYMVSYIQSLKAEMNTKNETLIRQIAVQLSDFETKMNENTNRLHFKSIVNSKNYVCVQGYKDMSQDAQKLF